MNIKRIQFPQAVILGVLSSMILCGFAVGRLRYFSDNSHWDVYTYAFNGYANVLSEQFNVMRYSLLLFPFLAITYLTTQYIDLYVVKLRYLSIYRFQKVRRWIMIHVMYFFVRCAVFFLVLHAALISIGTLYNPENSNRIWSGVLLLVSKQCILACAISLLQMYISIALSVHMGVIVSISLYGIVLLSDLSWSTSWKLLTMSNDSKGILGTGILLLLLLSIFLLNSQKKLLRMVFS